MTMCIVFDAISFVSLFVCLFVLLSCPNVLQFCNEIGGHAALFIKKGC
jgi:hypothetical protein